MYRSNRVQTIASPAYPTHAPAMYRLAVGGTIIVAGLIHTMGRLFGA